MHACTAAQDLIDVAMTSVHIPFFMDGWPVRFCRGRACIDGSLPDYARRTTGGHLAAAGLLIDYDHDEQMPSRGERCAAQGAGPARLHACMPAEHGCLAAVAAARGRARCACWEEEERGC